jgi:hypothetical protein
VVFVLVLRLAPGPGKPVETKCGLAGPLMFPGSAREFDETANWRRLEHFALPGISSAGLGPEAMDLRWPVW